MIKLYTKDKVLIGNLSECSRAIAIEERNGMCEIEIDYQLFSPHWDKLVRGNIIETDLNDKITKQLFRIYKVTKDIMGHFTVYAKHISFDLGRDYIESIDIENQSCEYCLNTLFRNSQFSQAFKGYSDIVNAQNYKINNVNLLKAIAGEKGSILDTFGTGAEIKRDNYDFYVLNKRGHDNGVVIEYASNLTGLDYEEDEEGLITRIRAAAKYTPKNEEGNNSEEKIIFTYVDSKNINNYETPFIAEIDFSDKFEEDEIPTVEKLTTLANKYFEENKCDIMKFNYEISFIPLSKCVGYEDIQDQIELCDTVTIIDYRYNLNTKAKVIKTTYDILKQRYESMELGEPRTSLGDIFTSEDSKGEKGDKGDKGEDGSMGDFPNTLPSVPTLSAKVLGFASIELSWTYENKVYYNYEIYASKTQGFTPNSFDLIHAGQTSSFLFQAKPNETWYFRACAINTHGQRTKFSDEIEVITTKVDDLENYFSSAAIGNAVVGSLTSDYMEAGIIKGEWIDAKNLSVTDGNGNRTLDIDSFGNVNLNVDTLKILGEDIGEELGTIKDKQSSMELDLNGFRTEVSNTYVSKDGYVGINFIKNGRMTGAKALTHDVPEWIWWGSFEVYDYPQAYGDKFVCLRPQVVTTEALGGIFQPVWQDDIPRNTQVTLSYYISWEAQCNGAYIDITYYKNDTQVGTTYEINKGQSGYLTHTFTTQDIDYDYFRVGLVIYGLKTQAPGSFLVIFGNVKLELGSIATAWCENYTNYTTKTEFQQTTEDFTFRIAQSGGGNLFKNTKFTEPREDGNGAKYWTPLQWDASCVEHWENHIMVARRDWNNNHVAALEYGARVVSDSHHIRGGFDSPMARVEPGRTYTFSCYIAAARTNAVVTELIGYDFNGTWTNWGVIRHAAVGANTQWGRNFENWTRMTYTFTAPSNMSDVGFRFWMDQHQTGTDLSVSMMIALPCLVEGSVAMEWVPHESEVYDGIVKIDNQGITVTHSNYDNFKTIMSATGFECIHTNTKSTLFDSQGLHTKLLHSNGSYRFKHKSLITKGTILTQGRGYDETLSIILPWQYNDLDANNDVSLMLVCNCPIADGYNWYNISYWNMSTGAPAGSWYKNSSGYWQCDNLFAYCLISAKDPRSDGTYHTEWARMYINYIAFA